ncbi:MAG: hypothetical protein JWM39_885 [Parcubacteria group bacterium]|nr:hypothetical protein [Parcubacteria group bacterium]
MFVSNQAVDLATRHVARAIEYDRFVLTTQIESSAQQAADHHAGDGADDAETDAVIIEFRFVGKVVVRMAVGEGDETSNHDRNQKGQVREGPKSTEDQGQNRCDDRNDNRNEDQVDHVVLPTECGVNGKVSGSLLIYAF